MADEIEDANDEMEARLKFTLGSVKISIEDNKTGKCIWCGEVVKDTRRWCSAVCRDAHTATYKL